MILRQNQHGTLHQNKQWVPTPQPTWNLTSRPSWRPTWNPTPKPTFSPTLKACDTMTKDSGVQLIVSNSCNFVSDYDCESMKEIIRDIVEAAFPIEVKI